MGGIAPGSTGAKALALAVIVLAGGCAHSTRPECPAPEASKAPRSPNEEYFRRVKARVNQSWNPTAAAKAHDPRGVLFGTRDRYVILNVTLDAAGGVSAMELVRSSGVGFLDEEAMDSFRRAAPFEAPPAGVLRPDGTVRFPFGFYMEAPGTPPRCGDGIDES